MRKPNPLKPLMFIPGTVLWVLIGTGFATGRTELFSIAVGVAACMMIVLLRRAFRMSSATRAERKRIWRDGIAATARIVNIGTKGGSLNDHPMIDFDLELLTAGGPTERVHTSAYISQLAIPRIQPGCEIQVRLDPRDRSRLVIDEALVPYAY